MRQGTSGVAGICAGTLALLLAACSSKMSVWVPPRVDLGQYQTIGLVEFASNQPGSLARFTSEQFLAALQACQPGVRVLELGPEAHVLQSIGHKALDFRAIREIGAKYGVDAVVTGRLEQSEVKPTLRLKNPLASMRLQADVEASLVARVLETASGATAWTGSANGSAPVGYAKIAEGGRAVLSAGDPDAAYGELAGGLAYHITDDFRGYWERR